MESLWCLLLILAGVAAVFIEIGADLDRISTVYVDSDLGRMRHSGNRCSELLGDVGNLDGMG